MVRQGCRTIALATLVLAALSGVDAAELRPGAVQIDGRLEVARFEHAPEDPLELTLTLANRSAAPTAVLRWQTPVDGIEADILEVTRDGEPVAYVGKLVKRAAPQPGDYLVLGPGETLSVTFDPSAAYDMSARGQYAVRYRAPLGGAFTLAAATGRDLLLGPPRLPDVTSNAVELWIEGIEPRDNGGSSFNGTDSGTGRRRLGGEPGGGGSVTGSTEFIECTTSEQEILTTARANALAISATARIYLDQDADDAGGMYRTWFDASGGRYGWDVVRGNFLAIEHVMAAETVTLDCTCNQNYYAYVYPDDPYRIYLCRVFWNAPALGTDSQAGTLVHETSHFSAVADTDDHVYGTAGARNLARTNPARAIENADSHEYFAEHQP